MAQVVSCVIWGISCTGLEFSEQCILFCTGWDFSVLSMFDIITLPGSFCSLFQTLTPSTYTVFTVVPFWSINHRWWDLVQPFSIFCGGCYICPPSVCLGTVSIACQWQPGPSQPWGRGVMPPSSVGSQSSYISESPESPHSSLNTVF